MSTSPVIALRKAMRARLLADVTLQSMLGGTNVFDEAPRGTPMPYATFGDVQTRDWSTALSQGAEHFVTINAWSAARGAREVLAIAEQIRALLDDASLTLDGNHLVSLRFVSLETRRENNGRFARAALRLRAVTEAN